MEGVDKGSHAAEASDDEDSADERIENLKNEITTLRNDLKLNVIKQQLVDTDQLTEDDAIVEGLEDDLYSLLVQLEDLIDRRVLDLEESKVSYSLYLVTLPPCLKKGQPAHLESAFVGQQGELEH